MKKLGLFPETILIILTKLAAMYHGYCEQENDELRKKLRAEDAKRLQQDLLAVYDEYYFVLAEVVQTAINNTVEGTHMFSVRNPEQLVPQQPVRRDKRGFYFFCFKAWIRKGYGITASDLERILQSELNAITDIYGLPRVKVLVRMDADGRVVIAVVFWSDYQRSI